MKIKISEFCKKERAKTGLNSQLFAISRNASRAYISKVENGGLDDNQTYVQIKKLINTYKLDLEQLYSLDINDQVLNAVSIENQKYGTNYNNINDSHKVSTKGFAFYSHFSQKNIDSLFSYLKNKNYTILSNKLDNNYLECDAQNKYDAEGVNISGGRFICHVLPSFAPAVRDEKRNDLLFDDTLAFIGNILKNEVLDASSPIELILFTSSDKSFIAFEEYKRNHILNNQGHFFTLKVVYAYQNQGPKELIMLS